MQTENRPIKKCIATIEQKLGWGSGEQWTHQDFLNLSDKILEETGESLSYITLKRIWGKVAYHSLPNAHTLNVLARFSGHDSWRAFQNNVQKEAEIVPETLPVSKWLEWKKHALFSGRSWKLFRNAAGMAAAGLFILLIIPSAKDKPALNPEDFHFSSKKIVSQGIPNSVVFDIDARRSPYDSVQVQQSWNTALRTTIPKDQSQHTSLYYFPGFFEAKLVVGDEIVKEHSLHITTDGWYCAIQQEPAPVYFPLEEVRQNGRMELKKEQAYAKNVSLQPQAPVFRIGNVRDFGDLKTNHFVFEARVRNTFKEGSAICQNTRVYLLCEGTAIWVPLTAKGCISSASLNFVNHYASGKEKDLSAFGVDFGEDVRIRMECVEGKAKVFLDGELVYAIKEKIKPVAIKGVDFRFQGLGSIDDVRLGKPDGEWIFTDDFEIE